MPLRSVAAEGAVLPTDERRRIAARKCAIGFLGLHPCLLVFTTSFDGEQVHVISLCKAIKPEQGDWTER
jgi:uncharacterized DUF497 family protein